MGQFTPVKTEEIRQAVLDCSIQRLTIGETQEYVKRALGISLSSKSITNYRARAGLEAQTWISKLAKSKKAEYIYEYKSRIDEVRLVMKKLWSIANDGKTWPRVQVEAMGKLLNCTEVLTQLYDVLPMINAIRGYDEAEEYRQLQRQQAALFSSSNSYGVTGGNGNNGDERDFRTPV